MKPMKLITALAAAALVAGCASTNTPSRNAPFVNTTATGVPIAQSLAETGQFNVAATELDIQRVNVVVPEDLVVSEANSYYPSGDIVWRGDAPGNRYAQVQAIFEDALTRGTAEMKSGTPVVLDVQVTRFHALTEKTRYTIGGVHSIRFGLALRDAETGALLSEPRMVKADLKGFGGQQAIDAERRGQTQKVRITDHLARLIQAELAQTGGHTNQRLGLVQAINSNF